MSRQSSLHHKKIHQYIYTLKSKASQWAANHPCTTKKLHTYIYTLKSKASQWAANHPCTTKKLHTYIYILQSKASQWAANHPCTTKKLHTYIYILQSKASQWAANPFHHPKKKKQNTKFFQGLFRPPRLRSLFRTSRSYSRRDENIE